MPPTETLTAMLAAQLTDPFRIGLVAALVLTMLRTEAVTGRALPLAAGIFFIAAIIPATMPAPGTAAVLWVQIVVGVVSNTVILAVVLALRTLWLRLRG